MKILNQNTDFPKNVSLILGFFDGIHIGHQEVIKNTYNKEKVLVTFSTSPAEYFKKEYSYIYNRKKNYELIKTFGVDYIYEQDFSKIATINAKDYLVQLIEKFEPVSITSGFNHNFGFNREGNSEFLKKYLGEKYLCTEPTIINGEIVSSTLIKEYLSNGNIETANTLLSRNFSLQSKVIEGMQLGRTLGFPTANLKYPERIIKIPYGVYKVRVFDKPAVLNWGIKPTIQSEEVLEVHIPNFEGDLYNQNLEIEFISKIRNEKKFNNLEELKEQIKKDIEICLK